MDPSEGARTDDDVAVRREVVVERLARLSPTDDGWEAVAAPIAMTIVDALLAADTATVEELTEPLRHAITDLHGAGDHGPEIRGYLLGLLSTSRWALQRFPDPGAFELVKDSQAWRMLEALESGALTSKELRAQIGTGDSQLSRVGGTLRTAGLVAQRRAGRIAIWELTPRGRVLLDDDHRRDSRAR